MSREYTHTEINLGGAKTKLAEKNLVPKKIDILLYCYVSNN